MRASGRPCELHAKVGCPKPACQRGSGRVSTVGTGVESGDRHGVGIGVGGETIFSAAGGSENGRGGGGGGPEEGSEGAGRESRTKAKLQPGSPLAFIRPKNNLEFNWVPGMPDPVSFIEITNIADTQLSFKIKCSTPDAYRVDPHWGFVDAGEIATIAVTLQPEWIGKVMSHKFLVAVIRAPDVFDDSNKTLKELWHSVPVDPTNYQEQKMTCGQASLGLPDPDDDQRSPYGAKITQINRLLNNNQRLSSQLTALVMFQLFLGLVIVMCAVVIVIVYYLGHAQVTNKRQ